MKHAGRIAVAAILVIIAIGIIGLATETPALYYPAIGLSFAVVGIVALAEIVFIVILPIAMVITYVVTGKYPAWY
jgi:hypothetical protein